MDSATLNVLLGIVRRESRSLLQYVGESDPFATSADGDIAAKIRQIVEEEKAAANALAAQLAGKRHRVPYLGSYPSSFTSVNYVTLKYLVPLLVKYEQEAIADLDRDLGRIADPDMAEEVRTIVAMKRRHLQTLADLTK
jgi:hypothetical protein